MALRLAFMGTPDFAVPALEALIYGPHDVLSVFTQPPRPKGRGHRVQPSPVHEVAEAHNIPVHTPRSLKKDIDAQAELGALDLDAIIVAAYGLMLPPNVLAMPKHGCLNIHASLLPRWRGAAPIQYAIWKGDEETGISIMKMEEGLDSGPVLDKRSVPIRPASTAQSIHDELAGLGAALITEVLDDVESKGSYETQAQDDALVTYAPVLKKEDGRVDWTQSAVEIGNQIRALNPWPGVWALNGNEKRLKILEAEAVDETFTEPPGTLVDRTGHVSCGGDTGLRLIKVQPENSKAMDVAAAVNGGYLQVDTLFS